MNQIDAIKSLPKVEQHVHLLGAIRPRTLLQAIDECGHETPYTSVEDIEDLFKFKDFMHFISVYKQVVDFVTEEKYFEKMTFELLEMEKENNVKYVEISFSAPEHIDHQGLDFELMMKAIERGISRGKREFGVGATVKIDLVRTYGVERAMETLDMIENRPQGIVSIDIGGPEKQYSPRPFAKVFARAREMGLHCVAHAGEAAGPESIWGAVDSLQVERIGHGVAAKDDEVLMQHLIDKNVTIEACPVSNLRTRVVDSLTEHPIRKFVERGISVTVNSDDPTFFETDMNNEYIQLHKHLGFTLSELHQLSLNAVDSSFLSDDEKTKLRESFENEFEKLVD